MRKSSRSNMMRKQEAESSSSSSSRMRRRSSSSKPFRFYKIILPATLHLNMLRMPETFVEKFGNEIPEVVTLTLPTGVSWEIGITKRDNNLYFAHGWQHFMEHNRIQYGYFLEFNFLGHGLFNLCIFDLSSCEIHYPPPTLQQQLPEEPSLVQVDADDDDDDDDDFVEPKFTITVRRCHLTSQPNYLHIPKKFVEQYMGGGMDNVVKLQVQDGREWYVQYYKRKRNVRLIGPEWKKFVIDNRWRLGEMYSFSILREEEEEDCLVLQVVKQ